MLFSQVGDRALSSVSFRFPSRLFGRRRRCSSSPIKVTRFASPTRNQEVASNEPANILLRRILECRTIRGLSLSSIVVAGGPYHQLEIKTCRNLKMNKTIAILALCLSSMLAIEFATLSEAQFFDKLFGNQNENTERPGDRNSEVGPVFRRMLNNAMSVNVP